MLASLRSEFGAFPELGCGALFADEVGSRIDGAGRLLGVVTPGSSLGFERLGSFGTGRLLGVETPGTSVAFEGLESFGAALPPAFTTAVAVESLGIGGDDAADSSSSGPPQSSSISSVGGLND
jgi:hypothetical protein